MSRRLVFSGRPKYLLSCTFSLFCSKWVPGAVNCQKYTWTATSPTPPPALLRRPAAPGRAWPPPSPHGGLLLVMRVSAGSPLPQRRLPVPPNLPPHSPPHHRALGLRGHVSFVVGCCPPLPWGPRTWGGAWSSTSPTRLPAELSSGAAQHSHEAGADAILCPFDR